MHTVMRSIGSTLLAASVTAVLLAQTPTPNLNVRMGLWEISSTTNLGGQMPGIDTSKMTPEQKARMEAAMRGMMGAHTTTSKSCMTKDKFEQKSFLPDDSTMKCKQNITTNTHTTLEANVACSGERSMTADVHFEAPTPTTMKGTIKSTNTERGQTMTIDMALTGKWLSADCGNVK